MGFGYPNLPHFRHCNYHLTEEVPNFGSVGVSKTFSWKGGGLPSDYDDNVSAKTCVLTANVKRSSQDMRS